MKILSKSRLALAGAAAIGSAVMVFSPGEAYAASLSGSFSFGGFTGGVDLGINPTTDTFNLGGATIGDATGDFVGLTIASLTSPFTITRTSVIDGNNNDDGMTSALYSFGTISNFLTLSNGFTFVLDPGSFTRTRFETAISGFSAPFVSLVGGGSLSGKFIDSTGEVAAFGSLALTSVPGSSTYGVSLSTVPIPTPALLPGLIGMGVAALRRQKEENA